MKERVGVTLIAMAIAALVTHTHASGWNDGSRLATVESLVDHGTWAIDDSIYVQPAGLRRVDPYFPAEVPNGTLDKLRIGGHYYSDKSPVPALAMAGPYWLWRQLGGPAISERPNLTYWLLSFISSGLAYVAAVLGVHTLARNLPTPVRLCVTASIALGSIALPYAMSINNHLPLLAGTTWLIIARNANHTTAAAVLAGIAYTIDLGVGPLIALGAGIDALFTLSRPRLALFIAASAPWALLHHALNYSIAGTVGPANAHPEFFDWPGCPFNARTMTGTWNHRNPGKFVLYAFDMLVGKRGLLTHHLSLLLPVIALPKLWRNAPRDLALAGFWCAGPWLLYAATSTNMAGECASVRWLVPLLAPGYWMLIRLLEIDPKQTRAFLILAASSVPIAVGAGWHGPWSGRMPFGYWGWVAIGLVTCFAMERRQQNIQSPLVERRAAA